MSLVTPDQILFTLRSVGLESYIPSGTYKNSYARIVNEEPIAKLAHSIAVTYGLRYDAQGNIQLNLKLSVDDLRNRFAKFGMWIPYRYRISPEALLTYVQNFGQEYASRYPPYVNFESEYNIKDRYPPDSFWIPPMQDGKYTSDIYLYDFRLLQYFSDFDLFYYFPFITSVTQQFNNRDDIIYYIMDQFVPIGEISVNSSIHLTLFYHDFRITFPKEEILNMIQNGYWIIDSLIKPFSIRKKQDLAFVLYSLSDTGIPLNNTPKPRIALYQLANQLLRIIESNEASLKEHSIKYPKWFSVYPSYESIIENANEVLSYVLDQIAIGELRGETAYRFSSQYESLNQVLETAVLNRKLQQMKIGTK